MRRRWGSRPAQGRRDTAGSGARSPQERRGEQPVPGGAGAAGGCEAAPVEPCRRRAFPAAAGFAEQTPGSPALASFPALAVGLARPGRRTNPSEEPGAAPRTVPSARRRVPVSRAAAVTRFAAGRPVWAPLPGPVTSLSCRPRPPGLRGALRASLHRPGWARGAPPAAREPFPWPLPRAFGVPSISQSRGTLVLQYCQK